jgi:hypothetical protein
MFRMILLLLQAQPLTPIAKPPLADSAWATVEACTANLGALAIPRAKLADVKWFTMPQLDRFNLTIAHFRAPDSIVLDPAVVGEFVIVAHELLHAHLGGPPTEPHPFIPFASCGLMPWQNDSILPDGRIRLKSGTILTPQ